MILNDCPKTTNEAQEANMSKTMSDAERRNLLANKLGLDPDAPALVARPERPITQGPAGGIEWAPKGVDPHTMPVTDIVFDPAMVEHFPDLSPRGRNAASQYLFAAYKSYGRDKDRNSLLHRRIGEFLAKVHKERVEPGGFVRDKIRLANAMAEHGVTEDDLADYLAWKARQQS